MLSYNRRNEESISITEFVMLTVILLLILIGFISSNPDHVIEFLLICIIAVIMLAVYFYIKKYAENAIILQDPTSSSNPGGASFPASARIEIISVIFPIEETQVNIDLPPSYEQVDTNDALPPYHNVVKE